MANSPKNQILTLLAREWTMTGPPGILDISDVASLISASPSDTMAAIKELFAAGLVGMNTLKTSIFLTPEGYEFIEKHPGGGQK